MYSFFCMRVLRPCIVHRWWILCKCLLNLIASSRLEKCLCWLAHITFHFWNLQLMLVEFRHILLSSIMLVLAAPLRIWQTCVETKVDRFLVKLSTDFENFPDFLMGCALSKLRSLLGRTISFVQSKLVSLHCTRRCQSMKRCPKEHSALGCQNVVPVLTRNVFAAFTVGDVTQKLAAFKQNSLYVGGELGEVSAALVHELIWKICAYTEPIL